MWNKSNVSPLVLPPVVPPWNRRLYVGAKKLVRWLLWAVVILLLPVLGAVCLTTTIALLKAFWLVFTASGLGASQSLWGTVSQALDLGIYWVVYSPKFWLGVGAAITWIPWISLSN